MRNNVQLIAYVDRLGGGGFSHFQQLLNSSLADLFGGVHLLPFFEPIDGADTGFDPIDHSRVDSRLGSWADVKHLSSQYEITADLIANHISADSPQFLNYLEHGNASEFSDMFLTVERVFPNGVTDNDLNRIFRPRPTSPFTEMTFGDGTKKALWTTFTERQVDIDVCHPSGEQYLRSVLEKLALHGVQLVRLDAVGYAIKKSGTSCFMIPETFAFIDTLSAYAKELGMEVLAETHTYYKTQIELASHVDWVYDFALPPLILHSLFEKSAGNLKKWLEISPRNAITVLDTHDGIGVRDIGADPMNAKAEGLVPPNYIDSLVDQIHENSGGISRDASQPNVGNLDLYQVNCTYFDALGRDQWGYLAARLIQFYSPGIPQVYYAGLLAAHNDINLFSHTGAGRDVNRPFYTNSDVDQDLRKPVVQQLLKLIGFRNTHAAFQGVFSLLESPDEVLHIRWQLDKQMTQMRVDFGKRNFEVTYTSNGQVRSIRDFGEFESQSET